MGKTLDEALGTLLDAPVGPPIVSGLTTLSGPTPIRGIRLLAEGFQAPGREPQIRPAPQTMADVRDGLLVDDPRRAVELMQAGVLPLPGPAPMTPPAPTVVPPRIQGPTPGALTPLVQEVLRTCTPVGFISGRAGTGKTTLAQAILKAYPDSTVLCATTGIAAVNLGDAITVNALLFFYDTAELVKKAQDGSLERRLDGLRMAGLRLLILDEVSMLAADQLTALMQALDTVNAHLKYETGILGGEAEDHRLRLILVGDFCQLPPVEAPYAFQSPRWTEFASRTITLTTVWRQENARFAEALHAIRRGDPASALPILAPCFRDAVDPRFDGSTIVGRNRAVDTLNGRRHAELSGEPIVWEATRTGEQHRDWKHIPDSVSLKPGALVMCLMNLPEPMDSDGGIPTKREYLYVNGDLGTVVQKDDDGAGIVIQSHRRQEEVTVYPHTKEWTEPLTPPKVIDQKYIPAPDEVVGVIRDPLDKTQWVRAVTKIRRGLITYMPLRLAWATTVHKSQGLSLDKVQVGISDPMFAKPGMLYVALSRCRTLEGLRIVGTPQMLRQRCTVAPEVKPWL